MRLPLTVVPLTTDQVNGPGHYSQAFIPARPPDVMNLIQYDLGVPFNPKGTLVNSSMGLNFVTSGYTGVIPGVLRYVQALGYLKTPNTTPTLVNVTITDPPKQRSLVVLGGVTLQNGAGFTARTATSAAAATATYQVFLFSGFIRTAVVAKTQAAGSGAAFHVEVAAAVGKPATAVGPGLWYQPQKKQQWD